ncbi:MAG: CoA transferase subunit A [Chloroflexi bacterium]|nr:CoA transferase subunit A [Chloroflexota bacterium]
MTRKASNKVMTAQEAVKRFVHDGATVGMGGQSIGRCAMAVTHEIVRQGIKDLTLVGCNLSMSMDILVGAGLAKRTECGTGNLERFGTTFRWRKAIEDRTLEVEDYSHLAMASRFLAGSLGLPFMPSKSMLGTDILNKQIANGSDAFRVIDNPWDLDEPVVLLPACKPDVSIIHAQKADQMGNIIIEGFTTQEPEMVKASSSVIVSCEELISSDEVRRHPDRTTVPYIFVDAVVVQPWGSFPTSTYGHYEHDPEHLRRYQACARPGGEAYEEYLREFIYECENFDEHLDRAISSARREELRASMQKLL